MKNQRLKIDIVESFRKFRAFSESIIKLESDIQKDDRLAVIIICAAVESVLDFLVENVFKHGSKFSKLHFKNKVKLLDEFGVIDDKILNNLTNLKTLRNTAAHEPQKEVEWKGKFAFDKNSTVYKETVKVFRKPKNLFEYLYCVWNTFFLVALEEITRKQFGKIVVAHKKLTKSNK